MTRIVETLLFEHDLTLVLLAAAVCAFGAVATMSVSSRAVGVSHRGRWLALLSVCAGATVWATHFIAMLAYRQGVATTYSPSLTILSLVSGVLLMGLGFWIAIRGHESRNPRLIGGAVVGAGVVVLHYVGMAALRMPGDLTYAPSLVVVSVLLSLGLGAPTLGVAFGPPRAHARSIAAVLMVLMIVSLHFTGMGAVTCTWGLSGR
jgi:NO-binding membrane sensor protein with MHYT domain